MFDQVDVSRSAHTCAIKRLANGGEELWDAFVTDAPQATFFHRAAWRDIIEQELGHRCHYLFAERDGAITGVLPLAEIRSRLFGHSLISTPFCVYGGIVASDPESEAQLTQAATALADELGVDYLEMRDRELRHPTWPIKDLYVTFSKELHSDHDKNWKAISGKRRNKIRKGMAAGLEARHDGGIAEFYRVYAESVRNLGTPVLSRNYYTRLKEAFGDSWEITLITHESRPVATAMSFYFRDHVHSYYAGSVMDGRDFAANDFMYWALMQRAVERGARVFDFGRSKRGTGSYDFKEQWGFEPKPLPYAYYLVRSSDVPNISPTNRKYGLFIEAWKRLPLPVSQAVGPWLARDLG
ncbi:MAG TPA: FemAB family XrtA/PEP-CTERM system-associated protein [Rhodanobacter sp.]|jgi:FemAB-related protein (PEP-CTERM system-associated)|nr:FemAB family XrtA/PEP-CTERM system-associated protein [Rhodanobacter sp.]